MSEKHYLVRIKGHALPVTEYIQKVIQEHLGSNNSTVEVKEINLLDDYNLDYWKDQAIKSEQELAEVCLGADALRKDLVAARNALAGLQKRAEAAEAQLDALKTEEEKNAKEAAKSTVSEEYLRKHGGTLAPEFEAVYDALVSKAREQFFGGSK